MRRRTKATLATDSKPSDSSPQRQSKRRRTKTKSFEYDMTENEEQIMLQHALRISKLDTKRVECDIPEAPVFHPTFQEFVDPLAYISSIEDKIRPFGICKIVPPPEWKPPNLINFDNPATFATKLQHVDKLQQGGGFEDGRQFNLRSYKKMADDFQKSWSEKYYASGEMTQSQLCKDYWDMVETCNRQASVEYGNDLDTNVYTSGFPKALSSAPHTPSSARVASDSSFIAASHEQPMQFKDNSSSDCNNVLSNSVPPRKIDGTALDASFYAETGWNLNNIPTAPGSVLQYLQTPINGINVPWLYVGMLFASFCWHTEDNYLYAVNYSHVGAVKQWYGVPSEAVERFEKVSKQFLLGLFREAPDLMHYMTLQVSPSTLTSNGVPVYKVSHEPGSFVVTLPKVFHAGFSYGFNVGEAVNFASLKWLRNGREAEERYRIYKRDAVFSHQRLLFTLLQNRDELAKQGASLTELAAEVGVVLEEELNMRPYVYKQGVKSLVGKFKLPPNDFSRIDDKATSFDERRCCCVCHQACILSAVGCECDQAKVACLRHCSFMCKCSMSKKFLLEWMSMEELRKMRRQVAEMESLSTTVEALAHVNTPQSTIFADKEESSTTSTTEIATRG